MESFKGDVLQVSTDKPTNQWAESVPRDTIRPIRAQYFYQVAEINQLEYVNIKQNAQNIGLWGLWSLGPRVWIQ